MNLNNPRVFIACPANTQTGGPEALHQLHHALTSIKVESYLWDPFDLERKASSPLDYQIYNPRWIELDPDVNLNDIIVIPEIWIPLIPDLSGYRVFLYWLSFDNAVFDDLDKDFLFQNTKNLIHLSQSHYASEKLLNVFEIDTTPVSDYVHSDYHIPIDRNTHGENCLISINPKKGLERSEKIINLLGRDRFLFLQNMSRLEVIEALSLTCIYLDLGEHPGKDRIPREARLLGNVVVTNLRGSAKNDFDVPIDSETFKINDNESSFEQVFAKLYFTVNNSCMSYAKMQDRYRVKILSENSVFTDEVRHLVSLFPDTKPLFVPYINREGSRSITRERLSTLAYNRKSQLSDHYKSELDYRASEIDRLERKAEETKLEFERTKVKLLEASKFRDKAEEDLATLRGSVFLSFWKFFIGKSQS